MSTEYNVQFGESLTADLEENTWTFEMNEDMNVSAGEYAIMPKEQFEKLISAIDINSVVK